MSTWSTSMDEIELAVWCLLKKAGPLKNYEIVILLPMYYEAEIRKTTWRMYERGLVKVTGEWELKAVDIS